MSELVDASNAKQCRKLDLLYSLQRLGCDAEPDVSFHAVKTNKTTRFHRNACRPNREHIVFIRPIAGASCAKKGIAGAFELQARLFYIDLEGTVRALARVSVAAPINSPSHRPRSILKQNL